MNEIIKKLEEWNCDIKGTMDRFLNDEDMYLSFLPTVAEEPAFNALGKALADGDARAAFEQSHLLKGVVANMGLTPILDELVDIVEPTRAGSTAGLMPAYERLMAKLAEFKSIIG